MKNVYLIYGAPCSGKTTYALEHAKPSDLIVDVDRICQAISINDLYDKPEHIVDAAMSVRNNLIQYIEEDKSFNDAYIIGGYPRRQYRQSLANRLHARTILIDTDIETCLARSAKRPNGYEDIIRQWFEDFEPDNEHAIPWVNQFYHSSDWTKVRAKVLELDHNECQICKAKGMYTRANIVHHVNHITDKPEWALDIFVPGTNERNLISVCSTCHNELHPEKGLKEQSSLNKERW